MTLNRYGELIGEDWADIIKREDPDRIEFHKMALKALSDALNRVQSRR